MNKEELKIVFLGTPEFAVESLKRLHEGGYNIAGVVTMPDKPADAATSCCSRRSSSMPWNTECTSCSPPT